RTSSETPVTSRRVPPCSVCVTDRISHSASRTTKTEPAVNWALWPMVDTDNPGAPHSHVTGTPDQSGSYVPTVIYRARPSRRCKILLVWLCITPHRHVGAKI